MSLAFKEWAPVVNALLTGRHTLILRKGGIAEDHGRFDVIATSFWLWPTFFHTQAARIKPEAQKWIKPPPDRLQVSAYAAVSAHHFETDWAATTALQDQHILTDETVRERFDWGQPPGIHLIQVQVFRLPVPLDIEPAAAQSGCKSWIEIEPDIRDHPGRLVRP